MSTPLVLSACHDVVLTLLRMADEQMLHESGNQVYLDMKAELERLRLVFLVHPQDCTQ